MAAVLATLAGSAGFAQPAEKKSRVVVMSLEGEPPPTAFIESLRIQLTGLASVEQGPSLVSGSGEARLAQTRAYLAATGTSIGVWEERRAAPTKGSFEIFVLAVTQDSGHSSIEVARMGASGGPEDDRILALKVSELLNRVIANAHSEQEIAEALQTVAQTAPPVIAPESKQSLPSAPPAAATAARVRGLAELGAGARFRSKLIGAQPLGGLALGVGYQIAAWRFEARAGIRWIGYEQTDSTLGSVGVREVDGSIGGAGDVRAGWLRLGLGFELGPNWLSASATANDGRTGSATRTAYVWSAGPEARIVLTSILEVRTWVRLENTVYAQRFAIEGVPVTDRPTWGSLGGLSLLFWVPR